MNGPRNHLISRKTGEGRLNELKRGVVASLNTTGNVLAE